MKGQHNNLLEKFRYLIKFFIIQFQCCFSILTATELFQEPNRSNLHHRCISISILYKST